VSRLRSAVPALLLAAGVVLVLLTFRDYGMTWDETVEAQYGSQVLDYFLSGFRDTRANELVNMRHYAPLFDVAAAAVARLRPAAHVELRHLLIAVLGLATAVGLYRLARRFLSPAIALLGVLFLATTPRFYGDAFNNPKDIPFACAFTWFVVATAPIVARRALGWRAFLICGLCLGWVGASRAGGLPLALLVAAAAAAASWTVRRPAGKAEALPPLPSLAARVAALVAVAWIGMVLPWPWAHAGPFAHPIASMREAARFSQTYEVLFAGNTLMSDQLPRTYVLQFLAIATPLPALALALLGIACAVRALWREPDGPRADVYRLLLAWLTVPLALFVVLRPNVYDGIRHFLFVLPALALFAALGAEGLLSFRARPALRFAAGATIFAALLVPAITMVRLHPYQSAYFNALVGGLRGAAGRYETDYWAASYKEAAEWINANRVPDPNRPTKVLVGANPYSLPCASHYFDKGVEGVGFQARGASGQIPPDVDFYLGVARYRLDQNFPESPVVHRVGRLGAAFSVIRARASLPK